MGDRSEHVGRRISEEWRDQSDEEEGGDLTRGWVSDRKIFRWWKKDRLVGKDACKVSAYWRSSRDLSSGDRSKN